MLRSQYNRFITYTLNLQLKPSKKFFNEHGLTFPEEEEETPIPMASMQNNGGMDNAAYEDDEESSRSERSYEDVDDEDVFSEPPPSYHSNEMNGDLREDQKDETS